jgi:glutathione peroxidase
MKKKWWLFSLGLFVSATLSAKGSFHSFKAKDIDGKEVSMSLFAGKKVMVVNVASKCGLTPQYKKLQALYEKYKDQNFVIVAFPANNFLSQEPGTEKEIQEFCSREFHVTFPMMSKISVKGDTMHPIYQWLTSKKENGLFDAGVKWNFQKFLIDENGKLVGYLFPTTSPDSEKVTKWIETGVWEE